MTCRGRWHIFLVSFQGEPPSGLNSLVCQARENPLVSAWDLNPGPIGADSCAPHH